MDNFRYLLKISYDGTAYHGWQVQPNGITVQQTLQECMEKVFLYKPAVTGCSRTDAGVHARSFFCHFDLPFFIECDGIVRGLNSVLPKDIRVYKCKLVENDFHCRYQAKKKSYQYVIYNGKICSPFDAKYALHYEREIDIDLVNKFCKELIGKHDFAAFSSSKRSVEDTVRTVFDCYAVKENEKVIFNITADGFLYNMVRIIVGTALEVNEGKISTFQIKDIFAQNDRSLAGRTAQPQGLYLNEVYYEGEDYAGL